MADSKDGASSDERPSRRLKANYIKSNAFRVIHADGLFGGLTPRGDIHIDFFSERQPIPQQATYELTPERLLGEEVKSERISKEGVIREVEAGVIIDVELAKSMIDWLQAKIDEHAKATAK